MIVYLGAIVILFLFAIMMLNIKKFSEMFRLEFFLFFTFLIIIYFFNNNKTTFLPNTGLISIDTFNDIYFFSQTLYNYYPILIVLAGLLLLIAMVGALIITQNYNKVLLEKTNSNSQKSRKPFLNLFEKTTIILYKNKITVNQEFLVKNYIHFINIQLKILIKNFNIDQLKLSALEIKNETKNLINTIIKKNYNSWIINLIIKKLSAIVSFFFMSKTSKEIINKVSNVIEKTKPHFLIKGNLKNNQINRRYFSTKGGGRKPSLFDILKRLVIRILNRFLKPNQVQAIIDYYLVCLHNLRALSKKIKDMIKNMWK
jgi:hypothetical protein